MSLTWRGLSTMFQLCPTSAFFLPWQVPNIHFDNLKSCFKLRWSNGLQTKRQQSPTNSKPKQTIMSSNLINIKSSSAVVHVKQMRQVDVIQVEVLLLVILWCRRKNNFIMSSKIKAAIRIRPFLKHQNKSQYRNSYIHPHVQRNQVEVNDGHTNKNYNFDYIFNPQSTQEDIYSDCQIDHLLDKTLKGYHATIFAYGQTGSGKTYTMHGQDSQINSGIIPKIFTRLFQQMQQNQQCTYSVYLSFLQIYNQRIFDLLNPAALAEKGGAGLRLRWNKDEQFSVQNLFIFECLEENDLRKYFQIGIKNRISASHKLNVQSSRSHSILTIRIQSFDKTGGSNSFLSSKLELVDLAGSERIGATGTQGKLAKESIDINKSLFTLRQVISILAESSKAKSQKDKAYVPYRDSKLTSILKQSIGGNSYCLMLACICPHDNFIDQNISTLTYATKASFITNQPTVNDDPRSKTINQLKKQIRGLNQELSRANQHIQMLSTMKMPMLKDSHQPRIVVSPMKRSGQRQTTGNQMFSERLVESINMVRELLKSNKQLRQKLQDSNQRNDEKDLEIFEVTKENQLIKQKLPHSNSMIEAPPTHSQTAIRTSTAIARKRHSSSQAQRSQIYHHPTEQPHPLPNSQNIVGNGGLMGFSGGGSRNNFNYWNSVEINQYIMNERGVDSVPTNFSRKEVATSQERRMGNPRNSSVGERAGGRNAMTAKFSSRNWKHNNEKPAKVMSFYQQNQMY